MGMWCLVSGEEDGLTSQVEGSYTAGLEEEASLGEGPLLAIAPLERRPLDS